MKTSIRTEDLPPAFQRLAKRLLGKMEGTPLKKKGKVVAELDVAMDHMALALAMAEQAGITSAKIKPLDKLFNDLKTATEKFGAG